MADAFHSARLTYRAIEENEEDTSFIHSLRLDSALRANSETMIFKPVNKASSAKAAAHYRDKNLISVLICLQVTSAKEGAEVSIPATKPIGLINLHPGFEQGREQHRNADIGVKIAADYQRKGYGGEAIKWILGWAFKYGGLHRVGISCASHNPGARRLYESLGFEYEGAKRESFWYDGAWRDELILSMLENEWRKIVQEEKS
ncbi:Spermidine N(1)-acetyltransferase [Lachnellula hyalina]|uniref:Spermidine N(1)-acetyltransferase n=1 Tax=Lachnellula hyalina TaxID=1316788 RepID=A0A8H8R403_9HELO|nr:Spermidine N(1)-acetyltransferase [Lachnellula hyalina]TVY27953.1 Spermidine N(1)-acetyltransferase [Lachnellula hyalina]